MRLIDADLLRKKISNGELMDYDCVQNLVNELLCEVVLPLIDNMPKKEERHGHWRKVDNGMTWHFECSICHTVPLRHGLVDKEVLSTYCPNCGAKMDEVEEDG